MADFDNSKHDNLISMIVKTSVLNIIMSFVILMELSCLLSRGSRSKIEILGPAAPKRIHISISQYCEF